MRIVVILLVALLTGCAPMLGEKLRVSYVPLIEKEKLPHLAGEVQVRSGQDARPNQSVGSIKGRAILPEGEVGLAVQMTLERYLSASGVTLTARTAPSIVAEVKVWNVVVEPQFPATSISANAEVEMMVYSSAGQELFRALYTGRSEKKDVSPNNRTVEKVLKDALSYAVREAVLDTEVQRALGVG